MKHHRTAVVALVGVLALAACQDDRDTKDEAGSDPAATPRQTSPCDLLTDEQRRKLTGAATPEEHELDDGCLWTGPEGLKSSHVVETTVMPASEWGAAQARSYRIMFDQDLVSPANRRKYTWSKRLLASIGDDDSRACDVFVTVANLDGAEAGSRTITRYIPPMGDFPPQVSAERCIDGTYTRLSLSAPGLRDVQARRLALATLDEISPITSTG